MACPRECSVCYERLTNPFRLRCGHAYCKPCVEEWYVSSTADSPGCPTCRRPISLKALDEVRDQRLEDKVFSEVMDQFIYDWQQFIQDFTPTTSDRRLFFSELAKAQLTIKALWEMGIDAEEILDFVEDEHWMPWRVMNSRKPWIYWDPPKPYFFNMSTINIKQQQLIKIPPPM